MAKRNPTPRQKKAAKEVVKNLVSDKPIPTGQVLENVGYGKIVKDPKRIIESEGFQIAVKEIGLKTALEKQGINTAYIAEKIDVLLKGKNGDKDDYTAINNGLKHATLIHGIEQDPEKSEKGNIYNFFINEPAQEKVKIMDAEIKDILTKKPNVQED